MTITATETSSSAPLPRFVAGAVALVGVLLSVGSLAWSPATTPSVVLGVLVAVLHLWSVAHWVKRALGAQAVRLSWVVFSLLKLTLLLGGLAWLVRSELVSMLSFLLGYAALPIGILMAQLFGPVIFPSYAKQSKQG